MQVIGIMLNGPIKHYISISRNVSYLNRHKDNSNNVNENKNSNANDLISTLTTIANSHYIPSKQCEQE